MQRENNMIVYNVLLLDRHIDPIITSFSNFDEALKAFYGEMAEYGNAAEIVDHEEGDTIIKSVHLTTEDDYLHLMKGKLR